MQKIQIMKSSLGALLLFLLLIGGCTKQKGEYYNYVNNYGKYKGTTLSYLAEQKGLYDSLLYVVENKLSEALKDTINNEKITFFVPSNKSFEIALTNLNNSRELANKEPIGLKDIDSTVLDTLVRRYLIPGLTVTGDIDTLSEGKSFFSLNNGYEMHMEYTHQSASGFKNAGPQQIIFSDVNASIFRRYWVMAPTSSVNVYTQSGIVHLLAPAHEFGFGQLTKMVER